MLTRRGMFKGLGFVAAGAAALPFLNKTVWASCVRIRSAHPLPPGTTLNDLVTKTLRARSGKVAENMMAFNALFSDLKERM